MALVARGLLNEQAAEVLYLSVETIKSHVRHILAKLGASNRAHAVALWAGGDLRDDLVAELCEPVAA